MNIRHIVASGFAAMAMRVMALGGVEVTAVTAHQRYPWNGLVDIVVTIHGSADDITAAEWSFNATNCATGAAVPVTSIVQKGNDTGTGITWIRRFVWDAATDIGSVLIDDVALTVDARIPGVQLWENGPYWAECNVGATKPEEYGYYFWWGDTVGYKRNASNNGWMSVKDGSSFSFNSSSCPTYGKNNAALQSAGYIDSTGNLVAAHDAATAHRGAPWRMPTDAEFSALINNCDTTWTTRGGVYGRQVTGRGAYASKSIFLPAAGFGYKSNLYYAGSFGNCWSSTLSVDYSSSAWRIDFNSSLFARYEHFDGYRDYGRSVRPLRGSAKTSVAELAVTTHLCLDCRTGVRECSADGEVLRYDSSWYENGSEARITENGAVVTTGTAGVYTWHPTPSCSTRHVLKFEVRSNGQVVGTETAEFESEATLAHSEVITMTPMAPACTEDGCTKGSYCSRCNAVLATSTVLSALGHVEVVTTPAREPTCTEAGCSKGSYCSRCGVIMSTSQVIPAGHIECVTTEAKAATCTTNGRTAEIRCSRCGLILQASETIPALGHIEVVTTEPISATMLEDGCTKGSYCSRCQEIMSVSERIPAVGSIRTKQIGNVTWNIRPLSDGWIVQGATPARGNVAIPETIDGFPVVGIDTNAFVNSVQMLTVRIPPTVTFVGLNAFSGCIALVGVTIEACDLIIEDNAFAGCTRIASVTIPGNVVLDRVFKDSPIRSVTFNNATSFVADGALLGKFQITSISIPASVHTIGAQAFKGCAGLSAVSLPDGLSTLGGEAFCGCTGLTSIQLPSGVDRIGTGVFQGCTGLKTCQWAGGSDLIPAYAFSGCSKLATLSGAGRVLEVSTNAFDACALLDNISSLESLQTIRDGAYNGCTSLTTLQISTLRSIGANAFRGCTKLSSVILPSHVSSIGTGAFRGCSALVSLAWPADTTVMSTNVLSGCVRLRSITNIENVTEINDGAFQGDLELSQVTIPAGLTLIGNSAFSGCTQFPYEQLILPESMKKLGPSAFNGCSRIKYVDIPATVRGLNDDVGASGPDCRDAFANTSVGACAIPCWMRPEVFGSASSLTSVVFKGVSPKVVWGRSKGVYYFWLDKGYFARRTDWDLYINIDGIRTVISSGSNVVQCTYPSGLEREVWYYSDNILFDTSTVASWNGMPLSKIVLCSGVEALSQQTFSGSRIASVAIPEGVTTITKQAFKDCKSLSSVTLPEGISEIEKGAFEGCSSLKEITIPSSVATIGDGAFNNSGVEKVIFDGDMPTFGLSVFPSRTVYYAYSDADGWPWTGTSYDGHQLIIVDRFSITFDGNGGTCAETARDYAAGETYGALPTPTRAGYSFVGWFTSASGGAQVSSATVVTDNATLYAHWTRIPVEDEYVDANVGKEVTGLDKPVVVPATWVTQKLVQRFGPGKAEAFRRKFGTDLAAALPLSTGKVGPRGDSRTVWDDYVAGTDPTDSNSLFRTTVKIVNGLPVIEWNPNLNSSGEERVYTIYGKEALEDSAWMTPTNELCRFFRVSVAMPESEGDESIADFVYSPFLNCSYTTLWTDVKLSNVTNVIGCLSGKGINDGTNAVRVVGCCFKDESDGKSVQFQVSIGNYIKCVKVRLQQSGNDVTGYVQYAGCLNRAYGLGVDFDNEDYTVKFVATSDLGEWYGVKELGAFVERSLVP